MSLSSDPTSDTSDTSALRADLARFLNTSVVRPLIVSLAHQRRSWRPDRRERRALQRATVAEAKRVAEAAAAADAKSVGEQEQEQEQEREQEQEQEQAKRAAEAAAAACLVTRHSERRARRAKRAGAAEAKRAAESAAASEAKRAGEATTAAAEAKRAAEAAAAAAEAKRAAEAVVATAEDKRVVDVAAVAEAKRRDQLQPPPPDSVWLRHREHVRVGAEWHLSVQLARTDPARIVCNGLPMCTDRTRDTSLVCAMFARVRGSPGVQLPAEAATCIDGVEDGVVRHVPRPRRGPSAAGSARDASGPGQHSCEADLPLGDTSRWCLVFIFFDVQNTLRQSVIWFHRRPSCGRKKGIIAEFLDEDPLV